MFCMKTIQGLDAWKHRGEHYGRADVKLFSCHRLASSLERLTGVLYLMARVIRPAG
jgi:hypothetical protein